MPDVIADSTTLQSTQTLLFSYGTPTDQTTLLKEKSTIKISQ
jgi:hypothetical protein